MTELAFHFGVTDKVAYACRLLRKAVNNGARVVVLGDAAMVERLGAELWGLGPTEFLTHCTGDMSESVRNYSPLILVSNNPQATNGRNVLVNLSSGVPPAIDSFARLIEIVSTDDADRQLARERWTQYARSGYKIDRHDVASKSLDT